MANGVRDATLTLPFCSVRDAHPWETRNFRAVCRASAACLSCSISSNCRAAIWSINC